MRPLSLPTSNGSLRERASRLLSGDVSDSVKQASVATERFVSDGTSNASKKSESLPRILSSSFMRSSLERRMSKATMRSRGRLPIDPNTNLPHHLTTGLFEKTVGRNAKRNKIPYPSLHAMMDNGPFTAYRYLRPAHMRIITLHLEGYTNGDVAKMTGRNAASIGRILKSPQAQEILNRAYASAEQDMKALLPSSIDALRNAVKASDKRLALDGASKYFKIIEGTRPSRHLHEHSGPNGGPIPISVQEAKGKLLRKAGISAQKLLEMNTEVQG